MQGDDGWCLTDHHSLRPHSAGGEGARAQGREGQGRGGSARQCRRGRRRKREGWQIDRQSGFWRVDDEGNNAITKGKKEGG